MQSSSPTPRPAPPAAEDLLPFARPLLSFALKRTANLHEAEDLVQDTLLHALAHLDEVRDPERLSGWLFRIAERRFIDLLRRDRGPELPLLIEPIAPMADKEQKDVQRHAALQRAVRGLPRSLRLPVRLHYIQGRPLQEVADALGTTISGVKTRLYRARHHLRERHAW